MSYSIEIVDALIPSDDESAWELLETLRERADEPEHLDAAGLSPRVRELYDRLTAVHPCIMEDPDGPWSDGPLINNFGHPITTLGISFSRVEETLPSVIEIATKLGFVVFDTQDERIHGPRSSATGDRRTPSKPVGERRWWQFWA